MGDRRREHAAGDVFRLLVCPVDKVALERVGETLICTSCGRRFPIEGGIPNMLIEQPT